MNIFNNIYIFNTFKMRLIPTIDLFCCYCCLEWPNYQKGPVFLIRLNYLLKTKENYFSWLSWEWVQWANTEYVLEYW